MNTQAPNSFRNGPDERGRFGQFGGRFVSETLMPLILDLEAEYEKAKTDADFWAEMDHLWKHYVGRPSPLYFAPRLTEHFGGAKIYLKRDELNHTGAHKINNVLGQILLARRMGKTRIIAETGAGQHGVATATVCARFGLQCIVYMGKADVERQKPNVFRMKLLGAEVVPVTSGRGTLKDAMNEALRDWVTNVRDTFYCIGTVAGPHPYPAMVRDFQSIIGKETKEQMQEAEGRLPDSSGCLQSAAGRTQWVSSIRSSTTRMCGSSAWKRAAMASTRRWSTAPRSPAGGPGCCTGTGPISFRMPMGKSSKGTRFPPVSTTPGSGRNIPGSTIPAGWSMSA